MIKENIFQEKENELLKTAFVSLLTSSITLFLLYSLKLKDTVDFTSKYLFFIVLTMITYALILPSIKQIRSYKEFPCMSGMMIGMTIGMISGFLPGLAVGATNGMFYGSIFGMFVGIALGVWNGKCCGIMGVMEGIMAGFMGGLMGAMTAVMMLNDNLKIASLIFLLISGFVLVCLNIMIIKETKGAGKDYHKDDFETIVITFLLMSITIWVITFGPRSALFQ